MTLDYYCIYMLSFGALLSALGDGSSLLDSL